MRVFLRTAAFGIDHAHAVEAQVLARPVEVGVRQIDRHALDRTADRGLRGRTARVAEQVQEALAGRLGADAQTQRPVIEKHAGVEVIREVHLQAAAVLVDDMHRAGLGLLGVLRVALLLAAHLEVNVGDRHFKHLLDHGQRLAQAALGMHGVDRLRRRVFLHMHLQRRALVEIDGDGVVRQVGVVEPVIAHARALGPLAQVLQVLAQTIREVALDDCSRAFGGCRDVEQQQLAGQIAVVERVELLGAQAQARAEIRASREHARTPAAKGSLEPRADEAVELHHLGLGAHALAVWRVREQQARRVRRRLHRGHVGLLEADAMR